MSGQIYSTLGAVVVVWILWAAIRLSQYRRRGLTGRPRRRSAADDPLNYSAPSAGDTHRGGHGLFGGGHHGGHGGFGSFGGGHHGGGGGDSGGGHHH